MRDDKQVTSRKNLVDKPWFWPVIYTVIALIMVAFILLYNSLVNTNDEADNDVLEPVTYDEGGKEKGDVAGADETIKYPFDEAQIDSAQILQDFYDVKASAEQQQNALLVFNQTYSTSTGISIGINSEPFQVLAAMSGEVKDIKVDAFTGNTVEIEHVNGMVTRYSSVADFVVEKGDFVEQGDPLGTTIANEWNPEAGVHLYFEVLKDGEPVNPRSLLAF